MKQSKLFRYHGGEPVLTWLGATLCALMYPVYIVVIPRIEQEAMAYYYRRQHPEADFKEIYAFLEKNIVSINMGMYIITALLLLVIFGRFLFASAKQFFREFRFSRLHVFVVGYAMIYLGNIAAMLITFAIAGGTESTNNEMAVSLISENTITMLIMTAMLAPFCEEMIFRAALFRPIYFKSRILAVLVTVLFFSLHHVWQTVVSGDCMELVYMIQYIPSSLALVYAYCSFNNVFGAMLMHTLANAVSVLMVFFASKIKEMI